MNRVAWLRGIPAALLAAAIVCFCFFSHLGELGLTGPDEPRYAWVAQAMAESGDWVTPHLYGQPWFEKPILYYWTAAAAFRTLGMSEFAARLPSALAALLTALGLAWAAWKLYDVKTAWATLLIFPTCIGVFSFARAATADMLFSAGLSFALVAAVAVFWRRDSALPENAPHRASRAATIFGLVAFGASLGAATLAKGPAGIILAGGSVFLWALVTSRWRSAFRLLHPVAILAFCVVALPWYILCALRNPDFVSAFLLLNNFRRYLTPIFQHVQPVWFFGPILLLGLLPWTAVLVGVARDGARLFHEARWKDSAGLFLACWAIFPVLFFSFSKSKLPGYMLPVFPPLALLLARSLVRAMEQRHRFATGLLAAVGGTWMALALSAGYWLKRLPADWVSQNYESVLYWVVVTVAAGLVIAMLAAVGRFWAALIAAAVLTTALIVILNRQFLSQLDPYLSARAAAQAIPAHGCESVETYHVKHAWVYGLNFYLGRELAQWSPQEAESACVFTSAAGFDHLARSGRKLIVLRRISPQTVLVVIQPERR